MSGWPPLSLTSFGNGRRKKSPSFDPRGTRKYAFTGAGSSEQSTPFQPGAPIGGTPCVGGNELHTLFTHVRPPKQSALDVHAPPTSPDPSGLHWVEKPTTSQRNPELQSASLEQPSPSPPLPPGWHVRSAPQKDPSLHSPLMTQGAPSPCEWPGAHFPFVHARPMRHGFASSH